MLTLATSVLIVSYNTRDLLVATLAALDREPDVEVVVVDNASSDGSPDAVGDRFPRVRLIRSERNLGFAAGVNRAAREASGDVLLLLNPDALLPPEGLRRLVDFLACHERAAAVGAALTYGDDRPQDSAFRFPGLAQLLLDLFPIRRLARSRHNGRVHTSDAPVRVDHPLGACMAIRRAAWVDVGPLDEGYFMYVEEVDWCRRARRRGWEVWHEPRAVAVHHGGMATRQRADAMYVQLWRSRLRYYQRFHGPGYNRAVRALVRLGMAAERRRAVRGGAAPGRLRAIAQVRRLSG